MKLNAVQFDELLGKLTPEMVAALCATVPTALHDQIEAAHTQAIGTAELIADHTDQTMRYSASRRRRRLAATRSAGHVRRLVPRRRDQMPAHTDDRAPGTPANKPH